MGATHFLTRTRAKVAAEMSLHVLAYNIKRVLKIIGLAPIMAALNAEPILAQRTATNRSEKPNDARTRPVIKFGRQRPPTARNISPPTPFHKA